MWRGRKKSGLQRDGASAFTLIELLVVIAIIAILAILITQAMISARDTGHRAACVSNLRQIGAAIGGYAAEHNGEIPFGPKAPPFNSPSDFYPSTGAPTSLLSLNDGEPAALGLLLAKYLDKNPKVLFCPGCDQPVDTDLELSRVGQTQAQGSYYYRHAGNTQLFDNPRVPFVASGLKLGSLGDNRQGKPVRALVIDSMFLCPPELADLNVKPRTHHGGNYASILFADGHAVSRSNADKRFTVDLKSNSQLRGAFGKILDVFERADEEP